MTTPNTPTLSKEDYRLYYQHQYDRMKELEQQRLTMTNVIVGLSVLAFSLAFSDLCKLNAVNGLGLPIVVIWANYIAVMWNKRSRAFVKMHQKRAHEALMKLASDIDEINKIHPKPVNSDTDRFRRAALQNYLHIALMLLALVPIGLYFYCCGFTIKPTAQNKCCPESQPTNVRIAALPSPTSAPTPQTPIVIAPVPTKPLPNVIASPSNKGN